PSSSALSSTASPWATMVNPLFTANGLNEVGAAGAAVAPRSRAPVASPTTPTAAIPCFTATPWGSWRTELFTTILSFTAHRWVTLRCRTPPPHSRASGTDQPSGKETSTAVRLVGTAAGGQVVRPAVHCRSGAVCGTGVEPVGQHGECQQPSVCGGDQPGERHRLRQ